MKLFAFLLLGTIILSPFGAYAQSLVGIDPSNYNAEQAEIFNNMSTEEQENLLRAAKADSPEGIVNCFDYYSFGSVQVSLNNKMSNVIPGTPVAFTGQIKNNNEYPVLDLSVYVKIFRVQDDATEQRLNGDFLVDSFFATQDSINLYDKSTKPIEFVWVAPSVLTPGDYRLVTYVTSAQKFNLSGLSFTDDVTGNSLSFKVEGSETNLPVEWDKNKVQINDKDYSFAKPIPQFKKDEKAIISVPVINPTNQEKVTFVTWTTYSWDGLRAENLLREDVESITLKPNETRVIEYEVSAHDEPVSYVVGKIEAEGGKSMINVRFANAGRTQARINFPALSDFPIKSGQSINMFSCFHSVSPDGVSDGKLTLSLLDENNNEVMTTSYSGQISGDMMGFNKEFVSSKALNKATLVATLSYAEKIEVATMSYDCSSLGEGVCLSDREGVSAADAETNNQNTPLRTALLFGLPLLVILIILVMFFIKKKKLPEMPVAGLFLLFASFLVSPVNVFAGQVTWTNTTPINPGTITTYGLSNSVNSLSNILINVRYVSNATKAENAYVKTGDVITISTPTSATDIDWFASSSFTDSPYGKWGNTPDPGCMEPSNWLESGGAFTELYGQTLVVRPTPTISATGMTCTGSGTFTCTVTSGGGPISATVTFPNTTGQFIFEAWNYGASGQPSQPVGSISKPAYYFSLLKNFFNPIPTVFALMMEPENNVCISRPPVPFTVSQQTINHNFIVDNTAFQPNLTAGSVLQIAATANQLIGLSAVVRNNGSVPTLGSFPNIIKVATAPNGGGTITKLSAGSQSSNVPAGDSVGILTNHTFTAAGTYSVQACADESPFSGGTQVESNEGDNCGAWTNITVSSPPSINLNFN